MNKEAIHSILKQHWGFDQFRPLQEDIIHSILENKDTLALLPTGGGKSICFQVPALLKEGICIVISPLIALMKDQVNNLQKKNIKAISIFSGMSFREIDIALDNCIYGNYKFLYVSPERLKTEIFQERLKNMNVNLIAVDEAHCISQWGYDFRPSYLEISELKKLLPGIPMLALTASATEIVKQDICDKLLFHHTKIFQKSFERKNIAYVVLHEEDKLNKTVDIFKKVKGSGIVYVRNRRKTMDVADYLSKNKINATYYHAGLSNEIRNEKQDKWIHNKIRVMVCTNAFGMGIDKPDVRSVVHLEMPDSMESYYQEAGRAGRDGKKSYAVLLFQQQDKKKMFEKFAKSYPPIEQVKKIYHALGNYLQIAIGSGEGNSYDFDMGAFCKNYNLQMVQVYHSLKILQQNDIVVSNESVFLPSRVRFIMKREALYEFEIVNKKYEFLIKLLLRSYEGLFEVFTKINETHLANSLNIQKTEIIDMIQQLQKLEVLEYEPTKNNAQITFIQPRQETKYLRFDLDFINKRKNVELEKIESMTYYAEQMTHCRSKVILDYFGEKVQHNCGVCDVCLERNKLELKEKEFDLIVKQLQHIIQLEKLTLRDVIEKIEINRKEKVTKTIQWLIENDQIKERTDKTLQWQN